MANSVSNKAGIKQVPVERFVISGSDIVRYLRDQLGFDLAAYDFTRWTGPFPEICYVRMRAAIYPEDIVVKSGPKGYFDRVLEANAADIEFNGDVMDVLKPFMYPESTKDVLSNTESLERLYQLGLYGERLNDIIMNQDLKYCPAANLYGVYLRPEMIIKDMLADPSSNKVDGEMAVVAVYGTTSDTIRWEVVVTSKRHAVSGSSGISLNAVFNS